MSVRPFIALYSGDYHRDTTDLTTEEHGAYLLLLMACWSNGGKLPDDEKRLQQITRLRPKKWTLFDSIFRRYFALKNDGFWHNKRIDRDLKLIENIKEARSKAGSKGAANRWQNGSQVDDKPIARARGPEPEPEPDKDLSKKELSETPTGEDDEKCLKGDSEEGRSAPLRAVPALKAKKKEFLRQKLLRFADARLAPRDRQTAISGLCGADPEHSEQWWLDRLDSQMRQQGWDDRR